MAALLIGFSSIQSNTLSKIYAIEQIPEWSTGLLLTIITTLILSGGAQRIGAEQATRASHVYFVCIIFSLYLI